MQRIATCGAIHLLTIPYFPICCFESQSAGLSTENRGSCAQVTATGWSGEVMISIRLQPYRGQRDTSPQHQVTKTFR